MEHIFLGTEGEWKNDGKYIYSRVNGQKIILAYLDDSDTSLENDANAQAMTAVPKMIKALIRVKAYLKENEDVLAPMPVRSETDSINEALKAAIYVPKEKEEPLESNGLPKSVNDAIKNMTKVEIRNFFTAEKSIHIRCEPIRDYILKGKEDFSMANRHNLIEKEVTTLTVNKFIGDD